MNNKNPIDVAAKTFLVIFGLIWSTISLFMLVTVFMSEGLSLVLIMPLIFLVVGIVILVKAFKNPPVSQRPNSVGSMYESIRTGETFIPNKQTGVDRGEFAKFDDPNYQSTDEFDNRIPQNYQNASKGFVIIGFIALIIFFVIIGVSFIGFDDDTVIDLDTIGGSFFVLAFAILMFVTAGKVKKQENTPKRKSPDEFSYHDPRYDHIEKPKPYSYEKVTQDKDDDDDPFFVKYCSGCGESLKKSDSYCPSCGKKVDK